MNKIVINILCSLFLILFLSSCNKAKNYRFAGINEIILSQNGNSDKNSVEFYSFISDSAKVNIDLTNSLKHNFYLDLYSEKDTISKYLNLPKRILIKAGENKASITIRFKANQSINHNIKLILRPTIQLSRRGSIVNACTEKFLSQNRIKIDSFKVNIKILNKIKLTPEQINLIAYYKDKYKLDILPLLGTYLCSGEIIPYFKFTPTGEMDVEVPAPQPPIALNSQETQITLSPLATKEKILLAMPHNAFGLNDFYKKVYLGNTIYSQYFYYREHPEWTPTSKIISILNWKDDTPVTFNVGYYTLEIEHNDLQVQQPIWLPFKDIQKLPEQTNSEDGVWCALTAEATDLFVPFSFQCSIWEKAMDYAKTLKGAALNSFQELVAQGSFNPVQILYETGVDKDRNIGEYDDHNITNYEKPSITYNKNSKSFDCKLIMQTNGAASTGYGYTQMNVTLTKVTNQ